MGGWRLGLVRAWAAVSAIWLAILLVLVTARLFEQLPGLTMMGLSFPQVQFAVPVSCDITLHGAVHDETNIDLCWMGLGEFRSQFPMYDFLPTYELVARLYGTSDIVGPRFANVWPTLLHVLLWAAIPAAMLRLAVWGAMWTAFAFIKGDHELSDPK